MAPGGAGIRRRCSRGWGDVRALGVDLGLDRVRLALARLGDPQTRFAAVQIAGTNGKGSTAAMTEAVLREAGLRTGLYSSPHLARFTERIRVDGQRGRRRSAGRARSAGGGDRGAARPTSRSPRCWRSWPWPRPASRSPCWRPGSAGASTRSRPACRARPPSPRSASTTPSTSATRWRRSRGRRPASSSQTSRASSGDCRAEADDEIARVADGAGAPLFRFGRDFGAPPFPAALRGRASEGERRAGGAARARGRPPPRAPDPGSGDGARAGRRPLAGALRARGRRPAVRLRAQPRRREGPGRRAARAGVGPPRRAAGVDRRRQGRGGDARRAGAGRRRRRDDALEQPAGAAARRGGRDGRALPPRNRHLRRSGRRARRSAPPRRPGRAGGRLRFDVPGRDAARARAGRARRPAADVRSRSADVDLVDVDRSLVSRRREGLQAERERGRRSVRRPVTVVDPVFQVLVTGRIGKSGLK